MPTIAVVVGVVVNAAGEILLAKRAAHQHQGGLWEFPGGKLESNESALAGLWRELYEELGISLLKAEPLIQIYHQYPDKAVLLDVFSVTQYDGTPQGNEGQPLVWVKPAELCQYPLPAANRPIVQALTLPKNLCISGEAATPAHWLEGFKSCLTADVNLVIARPFNAMQFTWPWRDVLSEAFSYCQSHNRRLLLHSSLLPQLTDSTQTDSVLAAILTCAHGIHLSAAAAADWSQLPANGLLLGMSCHNARELAQAAALNCNYALLSPVLPTQTHPGANTLGWSEFAELCRGAQLPVFALGGVNSAHTNLSCQLGGQGVAGIRGFWD
ncbi:MAG TPA: Nudix family hydrolase [Cellvibrionaceae bacterium]